MRKQRHETSLRTLLRIANYRPLIAEDKNRRQYKIFGVAFDDLMVVWQIGTKTIELKDADELEWLGVVIYE